MPINSLKCLIDVGLRSPLDQDRSILPDDMESISYLIALGFNYHMYSDLPFRIAVYHDDIALVKYYLSLGDVDVNSYDGEAHDNAKGAIKELLEPYKRAPVPECVSFQVGSLNNTFSISLRQKYVPMRLGIPYTRGDVYAACGWSSGIH